ncbi:hypothetical protein F5Y01DRAFT_290465 [Xylaria sp. FL0043]|nr:hypothetical protein F5Y01DRAFT_290465 [Xylaria sp. FL0043]
MSERLVAASRARRPPVSHSKSVPVPESNESQIMPRVNGLHCRICKSQNHEAEHCSKIVDDDRLTDRQQGFKRWCPWHKSAGHTMDQCLQKWNWLRDKDLVEKLLVVNCGAGPAFATNMLDWRWLVTDDSSTPLPWTPEYARSKKREDSEFHERLSRDHDPRTSSAVQRAYLSWQTENGQAPQFSSFGELQRHAEKEYQKQQVQLERTMHQYGEASTGDQHGPVIVEGGAESLAGSAAPVRQPTMVELMARPKQY